MAVANVIGCFETFSPPAETQGTFGLRFPRERLSSRGPETYIYLCLPGSLLAVPMPLSQSSYLSLPNFIISQTVGTARLCSQSIFFVIFPTSAKGKWRLPKKSRGMLMGNTRKYDRLTSSGLRFSAPCRVDWHIYMLERHLINLQLWHTSLGTA